MIAWMELRAPPVFVNKPPGISTSAPEPLTELSTEFSLPPLDHFAVVKERPLFSIDRRPSAIADNVAAWSSFVLEGILISPNGRQALLLHGSPTVSVHIEEGQSLDGWTATSVLPDRVVFANGHAEHELKFLRIASTIALIDSPPYTPDEKVQEAGPVELIPLTEQWRSPPEPNDSEAREQDSDGVAH